MIKKINLDLKTIIPLSILLCSNYYFFNDANFKFSHSSVIEVYFLLILFLLISFFIFKKFIDLILKLNFTVYVSLVYLFYTYFLVQIIKGFFYLSNYITIGVLISKIFDIDLTVPEAMFYKRFFIFFVPYIFCFIIIFSCKKNILKFLRFFTIVSYVFFVIVIFREIKTNLYSNINSDFEGIEFDYEIKEENAIEKNRKVLWIMLDAFDPEIAFDTSDKDFKFMNNFKELKKNSFFHSQLFPPARDTIDSMPAQLVGIQTMGHYVKGNTYFIKGDLHNESVELNYQNTIFGRLNKINFNSSILTSVFPYCSKYVISVKFTKCKDSSFQSRKDIFYYSDGIFFTFSIFEKVKIFFKLMPKEMITEIEVIKEITTIKKIEAKKKIETIMDMDGYRTVYFDDIDDSLKKNTHLTFVHLFMPHTSSPARKAEYAGKIFDFKSSPGMPSYILNLKLTDLILSRIINILNNYKDQDILLILSSDHWYREKTDDNNAYPVLFIAKILNDNSKVETSKETSAIYIQELIYKYLTKDISTHIQIKNFFEKKTIIPTYIPK